MGINQLEIEKLITGFLANFLYALKSFHGNNMYSILENYYYMPENMLFISIFPLLFTIDFDYDCESIEQVEYVSLD